MNMATKYWPGGIPAHIRAHPEPVDFSIVEEEVRGWQLFVEENWIARPGNADAEYDLRQRRILVDRWASADQAFRNSYQTRAPPRASEAWYPPQTKQALRQDQNINVAFCNCIASMDTPQNRSAWTKIQILLYHLDGEVGPLFGPERDVALAEQNPDAAIPLTIDSLLMWSFVENSDFNHMTMTSHGTIIFIRNYDRLVVDQQALDTGLALLCDFQNNGQLGASGRVRPMNMLNAWNLISELGKSVNEVIERAVGPRSWNTR